MSAFPGVHEGRIKRRIRRILKLALSMLWFVWMHVLKIFRFGGNKARPGTAVVLYYHSVPDAFASQFEAQMKALLANARPVALSDLNCLPESSHSVAVTFDDSLQSVAKIASPVLETLDIPATVFAVTNALGSRPDWAESYYDEDECLMSAAQLKSLPARLCVGSHSMTHPNLKKIGETAAREEILGSREKLESLLGKPVKWFCFPYGEHNEETLQICREAGYERVFTTEPVLFRGDEAQFAVGRVEADPWDWPIEFRLKVLGCYCWEQRARALKRKLWPKRSSNQEVMQHEQHSAVGRPDRLVGRASGDDT